MEGVRVRVQFEDPRILRKCQRKEGLQQSWVMLRPRHKTISDLSDHLLQVFKLQESCPRGLILSMDGFVLPPFETTSVLTDKDVVWVKRKVKNFTGTARLCDEKNPLKALEIADTQPVDTKFQLLAKEDFVKETGGYGSEPEEDEDEPFSNNANEGADAKKRKASRKLKSPKRKKSRLTNVEESQATSEDAGNDAAMKAILKDSQLDNDKISHNKVKNDVASTSKNAREPSRIEKSAPKKKAWKSPEACGDAGNKKPATKLDRHQDDTVSLEDNQLEKDEYSHKVKNNLANATETDNKITVSSQSLSQEKGKGNVDASPIPSEIKRFPSRSARRKKLKRQWQREMRKIGEKEGGQRAQYSGENDSSQEFLNNNEQTLTSQEDHRRSGEQQLHQSQTVTASNDTRNQQFHLDKQSNDMIVPIEIRPGHIRFEPLDEDAGQQLQKTSVPVTTFQWNGVTDKKKGQKWGKERAATKWTDKGYQKTKWTDDDSNKTNWTYNNYQKTEWTVADSQNTAWNDSNHKEPEWNKNQNINLEPSHQVSQGKETHPSDSTDFTKLSPYGTVPQEGDVVAYRLIELSSSWTPEISPFRVGKISSYNQGSKMTRLVPVPEHPFNLENTDKSLYGEDGSLEVDFTTLIEVRSLNPNKTEAEVAVVGQIDGITGEDSNAVSGTRETITNEGNQAHAQENGEADVWEEITQALSAKKAQLSQDDGWKRKEDPAKLTPPASYRGWRRGALGPIMAHLRAQNAML